MEGCGGRMLKKMRLIVTIMIIIVLSMIGCSNTNETQENEKFQKYYDSRVQYIGDNSKVSEFLNVIGVDNLGEYTIALKTDKEPYGLTINYSKLKNIGDEAKFANMDRIDYAYFALAMIENLNEIDINYSDYNYNLTTEQANEQVNGDIKDYGSSIEKLKELNDILNFSD